MDQDRSEIDEFTGRRPRWVWWALGVAVTAVVLVGAALGMRFGTDPSVVDSPMIGRSVPALTLPYLERSGSLSLGTADAEVLVVNFWASWCVPCRNEHDDLLAAASRYADDGVQFLGIVFQDQPDQAIAFLDELGRGYDHVTDPSSRAAIEFGVFGVPETYVIDGDGIIRAKIVGESDIGLLSATVEDVLAGREPGTRVVGDTESR
jgi:cytochrome c biogenesis protein CcmG/thiol:disulfide interchange protein DsbE